VTDGLAEKFPGRLIDFPPDETTLLGAAVGYSQAGLTPIIEVPYAKYLDCGVDTFYELAISNWLTNGQRPNGMVVRMQGFDRGLFGGNFHTHNMISHIPPGVDAVCYSNGRDYVRGFRNAIKQARAGRVVMFIDCTNLLNLRHLHDRDRGWETFYPPDEEGEIMGFDDVRTYSGLGDSSVKGRYAIVTYGNGVVTALQARKAMVDRIEMDPTELDVIDCPYLSDMPLGLKEVIGQYKGVLFADICKEGPGSNILSSMITSLQREDSLPSNWEFIAAPRTYNPLGNTITFLSQEDIITHLGRIVARDGASNDERGNHMSLIDGMENAAV
jgi:2-oxoisovalerate dehydrogenase E1 component